MSGDMQDSLGLRSDAHKLWQQGLMLAQQECQALGLKERQVRCYVERAWLHNHVYNRLLHDHTVMCARSCYNLITMRMTTASEFCRDLAFRRQFRSQTSHSLKTAYLSHTSLAGT